MNEWWYQWPLQLCKVVQCLGKEQLLIIHIPAYRDIIYLNEIVCTFKKAQILSECCCIQLDELSTILEFPESTAYIHIHPYLSVYLSIYLSIIQSTNNLINQPINQSNQPINISIYLYLSHDLPWIPQQIRPRIGASRGSGRSSRVPVGRSGGRWCVDGTCTGRKAGHSCCRRRRPGHSRMLDNPARRYSDPSIVAATDRRTGEWMHEWLNEWMGGNYQWHNEIWDWMREIWNWMSGIWDWMSGT